MPKNLDQLRQETYEATKQLLNLNKNVVSYGLPALGKQDSLSGLSKIKTTYIYYIYSPLKQEKTLQ